jgi:hypothetical protein
MGLERVKKLEKYEKFDIFQNFSFHANPAPSDRI